MTFKQLCLLTPDQLDELYVSLRYRPLQNPESWHLIVRLDGFDADHGYATHVPKYGMKNYRCVFISKHVIDRSRSTERCTVFDVIDRRLSEFEKSYLSERLTRHGIEFTLDNIVQHPPSNLTTPCVVVGDSHKMKYVQLMLELILLGEDN